MPKHKGLYKRGNVWWLGYSGPDGKIRFESSRSKSYKDAQALLIKRRKDVQDGIYPLNVKRLESFSFRQLSEQYIKWAERQKGFTKKKALIDLLLKVFANIPLRSFNTRLLEEYQSTLLADARAPATTNRRLATIKHMFTKAVEREMVEDEPLKKVRRVKLLPEYNRRLRYLSGEETQALIDACLPHLKPIVVCAVNTGMRKSEILGLTWEQIDLRHGFVLLDDTKNGERTLERDYRAL